jgi:hypothetical protein
MSWAARRRFLILSLLGALALAVAVLVYISTIRHVPSCSDAIQNQGEDGVDCGGPCPYLCSASEQAPTVLFTKALPNGAGRTDVIAEVENKNPDAAAKTVPYTVSLYDASQTLVQKVSGTLDLPPSSRVPVYIAGVASGAQTVTNAFLSIDSSAVLWYRLASDPRVVPTVTHIAESGTTDAPVIQATLANPSVSPLSQVRVVIMVRDASGNVIGASRTVLPSIPAQGEATATFTWNAAFPGTPVSIEALPVVPLP